MNLLNLFNDTEWELFTEFCAPVQCLLMQCILISWFSVWNGPAGQEALAITLEDKSPQCRVKYEWLSLSIHSLALWPFIWCLKSLPFPALKSFPRQAVSGGTLDKMGDTWLQLDRFRTMSICLFLLFFHWLEGVSGLCASLSMCPYINGHSFVLTLMFISQLCTESTNIMSYVFINTISIRKVLEKHIKIHFESVVLLGLDSNGIYVSILSQPEVKALNCEIILLSLKAFASLCSIIILL